MRTGDTPAERARAALRKRRRTSWSRRRSRCTCCSARTRGRAMLATVRTRDRRRDPRRRREQARQPPRAVARAAAGARARSRSMRIGLSATQKPIDEVARFLVGAGARRATASPTARSSTSATPSSATSRSSCRRRRSSAVMSNDQWEQVYDRIAELVRAAPHHAGVRQHPAHGRARRAPPRRAARQGSASPRTTAASRKEAAARRRAAAEARRAAGAGRHRVARARHRHRRRRPGLPARLAALDRRPSCSASAAPATHVGGVPKARLFPQSRDELVECAALLDCVRRGELDALRIAAGAARRAGAADRRRDRVPRVGRGRAVRAGAPRLALRASSRASDFDAVVRMLAEGFTHAPRPARRLRPPRRRAPAPARRASGARLTALTSGGTIPETGDYAVVLEPQALNDRHVNEDFAVESIAGDVFQLGNTSYRILRVEPGRVRVEDAQGAPPSIPFWLGEAPGRSDELSLGVSRLRAEVGAAARRAAALRARRSPGCAHDVGLDDEAARQLVDYLAPRARRARRAADAASASSSSASSTNRAACSWSSTRRSAAASTAPGAWRCASASAASSTSSCRRRRPRTRSCCRCRPATASRSTRSRATCTRRPRSTCWCRRCSTRRCSACAGAGTRPPRWRCRASPAARKVAPQLQRMKSRGPARRACSPTRSPAPRTSPASARCPTTRWSRRRCATA